MLDRLSQKLYSQLLQQLEENNLTENSLDKFRNGLTLVQNALIELKLAVHKNGFADVKEEIYFFKKGKPAIYALLIFITERYAIENSTPLVGREQQLAHLESQLMFINRFFRQNEFLYQYYRLNATELDDRYFLRNGENTSRGFAEVPDVDPSFSTVGDYLFSKFIAYEMLQGYVLDEIQAKSSLDMGLPIRNQRELKWTGDVVNVVELIYGVYETGQINEGKASLAELMEYFGQVLQINLTKYFKRFSDIKRRKSMSKTRFLDEMRDKVNQRIEDSDAFIPEDQRARYGY